MHVFSLLTAYTYVALWLTGAAAAVAMELVGIFQQQNARLCIQFWHSCSIAGIYYLNGTQQWTQAWPELTDIEQRECAGILAVL